MRHPHPIVLIFTLLCASVGRADAGQPPASISLVGPDAITEKACTGPFRATLRSVSNEPLPAPTFMYFWMVLEGAKPGWTNFFRDEACTRRIQTYSDNGGDGRIKARLDFQQGVSERVFYVKSRKIVDPKPGVTLRLRGLRNIDSRWNPRLAITLASAEPAPRPVSQASLARRAETSPAQYFNDWNAGEPVVERCDIASANMWGNELIVRSRRLPNVPSDCATSVSGCPVARSYLSAVRLTDRRERRLHEWETANGEAGMPQRNLVREKITGDHLVMQYGRKPARLVAVDLRTGTVIRSGPLDMRIDDFAVHGDRIAVSHFEELKHPGARVKQRMYSVSTYSATDFAFVSKYVTMTRPIIGTDKVYALLEGLSTSDRATVIVTPMGVDGTKEKDFKGQWPKPKSGCRSIPEGQSFSNARYYVEINYCGIARGIDFEERRLFHVPTSLSEQFESPAYSLTRDYLVVQGGLKNANRGAGDAGRPLYFFDLAAAGWQGRLDVGPFDGHIADALGNVVALTASAACSNPYGVDDGRALKNPTTVQRVQLLDEAIVGNRGADLARSFWHGLAKADETSFARFPWGGDGLRKLHAKRSPAQRGSGPSFRHSTDQSIGEFELRNSNAFRQALSAGAAMTSKEAAESGYACEVIDIPLYRSVGDEPVGWLSLTVKPGAVEGPEVSGWLADLVDKKLTDAPVVYRDKYYPVLPVFETADGGWFRIAGNGKSALWADIAAAGPEFAKAYRPREHRAAVPGEL